jgi:hypothetical protein
MPGLNFILPHWLYWSGMLLFPLLAWRLAARQRQRAPDSRPSLFIAGFFWLLAGYMGIHRFYLRSAWGFVFIPVFLAIIYCNGQERDVRDETSRTFAELEVAQRDADTAPAVLTQRKTEYETAQAVTDHWHQMSRNIALLLLAMLLVDGAMLPRMVRRRRALEEGSPAHQPVAMPELHEGGVG